MIKPWDTYEDVKKREQFYIGGIINIPKWMLIDISEWEKRDLQKQIKQIKKSGNSLPINDIE